MISSIKRYFAVRSYAMRLSQDLVRRFGRKSFYSIKQVTQAVERGKFSTTFIHYAHATFCSLADFEAEYNPPDGPATYREIRGIIGRRYLQGQFDFDATALFKRFRQLPRDGDFYESGQGEDYTTHSS